MNVANTRMTRLNDSDTYANYYGLYQWHSFYSVLEECSLCMVVLGDTYNSQLFLKTTCQVRSYVHVLVMQLNVCQIAFNFNFDCKSTCTQLQDTFNDICSYKVAC